MVPSPIESEPLSPAPEPQADIPANLEDLAEMKSVIGSFNAFTSVCKKICPDAPESIRRIVKNVKDAETIATRKDPPPSCTEICKPLIAACNTIQNAPSDFPIGRGNFDREFKMFTDAATATAKVCQIAADKSTDPAMKRFALVVSGARDTCNTKYLAYRRYLGIR